MSYDYDLLIIGAGSAGLAAAKRATSYGVHVGIAEQADVGGACINYGCIPEKLMAYAANFSSLFSHAISYGWSEFHSNFDWSKFIAAKDQKVEQLHQLHIKYLKESGVDFIKGRASFVDAHTLDIDGRQITADKILITVGAQPLKPNIPGIEYTITPKELFQMNILPKHIAIIGGDYTTVKTAGSLNKLGVKVTLITDLPQILPACDQDFIFCITDIMSQAGIEILTNTKLDIIKKAGNKLDVFYSNHENNILNCDTVLSLILLLPNLNNLYLDKAGIKVSQKGAIMVDKYSCTTQANIFAVGDCIDRLQLTPVAIAEARAFVETEFGNKPQILSYELVPITVSFIPEAATVGLAETQAREKFGESIHCYYEKFQPLFYSLNEHNEKSFIKLIVESNSERVLGVHMVGDSATEIIQTIAVAMKLGATKKDLNNNIGIHPSSAEEIFSV
ncbi:glutathione-disulfide reductase [Nostoc flagelliforme FACHB-838]|uniref:Glutathione-disulfide reductase n=1 Tax=Nostoc flagelliforme FACHB-838 TaxID=2692904 RepID=A0ABR8E2P1_9NOSO|nr:glutathione-disulfide reductase [Nostoc flagelliforme]MBD2535836.1 glutathione-disulfide reductase [Nostoc flagelliforme FACHB-838]